MAFQAHVCVRVPCDNGNVSAAPLDRSKRYRARPQPTSDRHRAFISWRHGQRRLPHARRLQHRPDASAPRSARRRWSVSISPVRHRSGAPVGARPVATMLTRLLQPLTLFLAQPVKPPADRSDPLSLRDWLLPGDVLLTDGITRGAALVRRITRSPWAHVSMYVGPLGEGPDAHCIVEADVAAGGGGGPPFPLARPQLRVLRPPGLDHPPPPPP